MEKRIHKKIEEYTINFNTSLETYIETLANITEDNKKMISQFLEQYPKLHLTKEDFQRRKRVKNVVPFHDRCCAKRANGERCTRRKKEGSDYCGTHCKGQPHGVITEEPPKDEFKTLVVRAQDIKGIIYYLDDYNNVYDPKDIINGIKNPKIIAKYTFNNNIYSIPSFNI